jgi:molybdate transport system regulatory protein
MPRAAGNGFPRLWLRVDLAPGVSLGPGKVELLRGIDETGSISAAGRRIGMSYKRAWQLVDALNRHFASPLVAASRGGARGGGASLTPLGHTILATYLALQTAAHDAAKGKLAELTAQLRAADDDPTPG